MSTPRAITAPSRRQLLRTTLGVGLGLGAGTLLGACGSDDQTDPADAGASKGPAGPWRFTDDLGEKHELKKRPTRIAGLTDVMAALWNYGITPTATFGQISMHKDVQFEGKDLKKVSEVGAVFGEINLEKLAAERPELIVTTVYSKDPKTLLYGFKDKEQLAKVRQIAPVAAIAMVGVGDTVMSRVATLAKSLGGDIAGEAVTKAKSDLTAASEQLKAAAERGITTLCLAGYPSEAYLAKPPDDPYLAYYRKLGMKFVLPEGKEFFWEKLSWEQINTYPADVVLCSQRATAVSALQKIPTFAKLPAVKAGQVHDWKYTSPDYVGQAKYVGELAAWLSDARKVT